MPHSIKPMKTILTNKPFDDKEWILETKFDGYRAIAEIKKGKVNLHSRNNNSFNKKFAHITDSLEIFDFDIILDGEIVVLDKNGVSKFQLLQKYQRTRKGNLIYYIFDLLYINGYGITKLPLIKRKNILKKITPKLKNIRYCKHIRKDREKFSKKAKEKNWEGMIAKDAYSEYKTNTRSKKWLKVKTKLQQEAVIGGYTKPKGERKRFGSLILGVYKKTKLIYIGHSGGGFSDENLDNIYSKLKKIERKTPPFEKEPNSNTSPT
jgi:bifunctional non-homologous end joining protein LigD